MPRLSATAVFEHFQLVNRVLLVHELDIAMTYLREKYPFTVHRGGAALVALPEQRWLSQLRSRLACVLRRRRACSLTCHSDRARLWCRAMPRGRCWTGR